MTKPLTAFVAVVALVATCGLSGCGGNELKYEEGGKNDKRFVVSSSATGFTANVVVDSKTGVEYLVVIGDGSYGRGSSVTVIVDADGKPLIDRRTNER